MGRRLRYIPDGGALVEVTTRTIQGRFLLRPSREFNRLVVGVIARAKQRVPVRLHYFVVMSNHIHLLLSVENAKQLASFMEYVNGNIAKEAGRLHCWSGPFWSRRYQPIVVTAEDDVQLQRLRYLLSHGCKEGLVARPDLWPGASGLEALRFGGAIRGVWIDRTRQYRSRRHSRQAERETFVEDLELRLEPLPCWQGLSEKERRWRVGKLLKAIESETAEAHRRRGTRPAGRRFVRRQRPHDRPPTMTRSPASLVHAGCRETWIAFREGYRSFVSAYRDAVAALRSQGTSLFPAGCFPPPLPFVRTAPAPGPG